MAIKEIPLPDWEDLTDLLGLELDEPGGLDLLDLGGYVGQQAYEQLRPDPWAKADPWAAQLAGGLAGLIPLGAMDIPGVELRRLAKALRRAPVLDPAFTKAIESLRKIPSREWSASNRRLMELITRPGKTTKAVKEQIAEWSKNLDRTLKQNAERRWGRKSGWRGSDAIDTVKYTPGPREGIRGPIRTDITKAPPGSYTGRKYLPPARGGGGLTEIREGMRKAGYTRKQTGEFMEYLTKKVKQAQDEFWKKR